MPGQKTGRAAELPATAFVAARKRPSWQAAGCCPESHFQGRKFCNVLKLKRILIKTLLHGSREALELSQPPALASAGDVEGNFKVESSGPDRDSGTNLNTAKPTDPQRFHWLMIERHARLPPWRLSSRRSDMCIKAHQ